MDNKENYGAFLERGIVEKITNDGCIIASLSRAGLKSLPLKSIVETDTFSVGEKVYFFLFNDGEGKIISKI